MDGVPVDLRADGVLWLINKAVFHPRGFALGVEPDGSLILLGNGKEAWTFDVSDKGIAEDQRFNAVEALLARAREANQSS